MNARAMTRRSLLLAGAGALAGGLVRPRGVLAWNPREPSLSERSLGSVGADPVTVSLAGVADLAGVGWRGSAKADVELRFRGSGGRWSEWVSAGSHGHAPEVGPREGDRHVGDPIWTGGTSVLQVRASPSLSAASLHLIDVSGGIGAAREARLADAFAATAPLALAEPRLQAGPGQPPIIAREGWAKGVSPPRVAPEYGAVEMAFVHHTENPNGYLAGEVPAMLRAIYIFHRYVRGWNDIGYNFVVDLYGRIFEARAGGIDQPVVGAQAGGYNLASTGVAVLGSFMSTPISPQARTALENLLAWKLSLHGVSSSGRATVKVNPAGAIYSRFPANARVSLPRIAGHRDADSTDCPGNTLYGQLPGVRAAVGRLAPRPLRVTLQPAIASAQGATSTWTPVPEPPAAPVPAGLLLTGTVRYLDGAPIAGAAVLVQARLVSRRGESVTEQTLGQAVTDAEGVWSLAVTPGPASAKGVSLRALCLATAGRGASVSEAVHLAYTVSLSSPQAPSPTPPAGAPPAT